MNEQNTPLRDAIRKAGSQAKLGAALGVPQQNVSHWLRSNPPAPPVKYWKTIEREFKVKAIRFLDLYE